VKTATTYYPFGFKHNTYKVVTRTVDSAIIDRSIKNGVPYFLNKDIYHLETLKQ